MRWDGLEVIHVGEEGAAAAAAAASVVAAVADKDVVVGVVLRGVF